MSLNIKDEEVDRLARQLSKRTGETITDAVRTALQERLVRLRAKAEPPLSERLMAIGRRTAALPRLTDKTGKELMDELYDEYGLPR
jgi:antitoxin VapB